MIDLTDGPTAEAADLATSRQIAERLNGRYPGYLWMVHVQWGQGIAIVRNLSVSAKYGYVLKLLTIWSSSELDRQVDEAGGEILERFRLNRRGFDGDEYDALPVNAAGMVIGDMAR
jgi:hypothetical protein